MKKCPYCAEKIQDEAIVCRYCGRDLPPELNNKLQNKTEIYPSVWKQGAKGSVVITVLYAINAFINSPNSFELIGNLTIGIVTTFLFWWLVCTGVVWIWRKLGISSIAKVLLISGLLVALLLLTNFVLDSNTYLAQAPTQTPTQVPTPTHKPCYRWDERLSNSTTGSTVCVYGNIVSIKYVFDNNSVFQYTLIRFSESSLRIYSRYDSKISYDIGECVVATGILEYDENGAPFVYNKGFVFGC